MNRQRGMTIVELLVSLAVVMLILGTATRAYIKLLGTYKTQGRLAEGYMAKLTGLEILRYDIEMAGYGVPVNPAGGPLPAYNEAAAVNPPFPYNPAGLNDAPSNAPRALAHLNDSGLDTTGANPSDVLTIKSSVANMGNPTSKKWSLITNSGVNPAVKRWGGNTASANDFAANDRFIVVDGNYNIKTVGANWFFTFSSTGQEYINSATPNVLPDPGTANQDVYYMYGLDTQALRMPFNRVDYYLDNTTAADIPSSCAPGTAVLYRSTISQADGSLQKTPLVDCVADFQVAFGLDPSGTYTPPFQWQANLVQQNWMTNYTAGAPMTGSQLKQYLREVRVFLVYQEGTGDIGKSADFRSSTPLTLGGANGAPLLSTFTPGSTAPTAKQVQYRWKILEMDIKPMNLR